MEQALLPPVYQFYPVMVPRSGINTFEQPQCHTNNLSLDGYRSRRDIPALGNCELIISAPVPLPPKYPTELKDIGDHLLKRRYDLKLSQPKVAKIIGVSTDTITYWENKRSKPQIYLYSKVIEFLGYNPYETDIKTFGDKVKQYRFLNSLSQKRLANLIGIDPSTIKKLEENWGKPQKESKRKLLIYFRSIF